MAELALPIFTAPPPPTLLGLAMSIPAADAATGAAADPFASLIAALAPVSPAGMAVVPVSLATPKTIMLPLTGDGIAVYSFPAEAAGDDMGSGDPATPVSDVVAMLTFVPPPVAAPVAVTPKTVAPSESAMPIAIAAEAPAVRSHPFAIAPAAPRIAKPPQPTENEASQPSAKPVAPPIADKAAPVGSEPAAEIVRLLKAGVSPIALATPAPQQTVATAPPATGKAAAIVPEAAATAVEAPTSATPAQPARRPASIAPRSVPVSTARRDDAAISEHVTAERSAEPRHPRAEGAMHTVFVDPRIDPARPADVGVAAPAARIDDPVARQLDMAKDGQWLDTLAKDIAMAGGKDGQLSFRLDPVSLGSLTVQISQGDDGASVRLSASTEQARAILAEAQPRLVAEARAQGLHLREATVDSAPAPAANGSAPTGGGGQGRGEQGNSAQLQQQQQQQQQGRRGPTQPQPDGSPARTGSTPARDSAELYA